MINCKPYQQTFKEDLQTAFRNRDQHFFNREIKRLCKVIASRANDFDNSIDFDYTTSRLQICLALVDSLVRHGDTTKLINDVVNF